MPWDGNASAASCVGVSAPDTQGARPEGQREACVFCLVSTARPYVLCPSTRVGGDARRLRGGSSCYTLMSVGKGGGLAEAEACPGRPSSPQGAVQKSLGYLCPEIFELQETFLGPQGSSLGGFDGSPAPQLLRQRLPPQESSFKEASPHKDKIVILLRKRPLSLMSSGHSWDVIESIAKTTDDSKQPARLGAVIKDAETKVPSGPLAGVPHPWLSPFGGKPQRPPGREAYRPSQN